MRSLPKVSWDMAGTATCSVPTVPSFGSVIEELYRRTGRIEASFSSKLLSALDPNMPIWDSIVLSKLHIKPALSQVNKRNMIELLVYIFIFWILYRSISKDSRERKKRAKRAEEIEIMAAREAGRASLEREKEWEQEKKRAAEASSTEKGSDPAEQDGNVMICPRCGKEMQFGYFQAGGIAAFNKTRHRLYRNPEDPEDITIHRSAGSASDYDGWLCRDCCIVAFDYGRPRTNDLKKMFFSLIDEELV